MSHILVLNRHSRYTRRIGVFVKLANKPCQVAEYNGELTSSPPKKPNQPNKLTSKTRPKNLPYDLC